MKRLNLYSITNNNGSGKGGDLGYGGDIAKG